ncbi:MAG: hypothetical protein ACI3W8_03080 [Oscillospiraceae bacterium]
MLFRKDMEPSCQYCAFGHPLSETEVGCEKRGVVEAAGSCHRFRYDPLKRVPPRPAALDTSRLKKEDFSL